MIETGQILVAVAAFAAFVGVAAIWQWLKERRP